MKKQLLFAAMLMLSAAQRFQYQLPSLLRLQQKRVRLLQLRSSMMHL